MLPVGFSGGYIMLRLLVWILTFKFGRVVVAILGWSFIVTGVAWLAFVGPAFIKRGAASAFAPATVFFVIGVLFVWVSVAPKPPKSRWRTRLPSELPHDAERPD
jgi:uncharacterized membrane protein YGL010W